MKVVVVKPDPAIDKVDLSRASLRNHCVTHARRCIDGRRRVAEIDRGAVARFQIEHDELIGAIVAAKGQAA